MELVTVGIGKLLNGATIGHRANGALIRQITAFYKTKEEEIKEGVIVRIYKTDSHFCYCCVWVYFPESECTGSSKIGAFVYNQEQEAIKAAFASAGIELYDISFQSAFVLTVSVAVHFAKLSNTFYLFTHEAYA